MNANRERQNCAAHEPEEAIKNESRDASSLTYGSSGDTLVALNKCGPLTTLSATGLGLSHAGRCTVKHCCRTKCNRLTAVAEPG